MYGSILVLAKKKAAGPGAYFDPMGEHGGMASGPMMFEMAQEEGGEEEDEDEGEEMQASTKPQLSGMNFREAADKLREIADALQASSVKHAGQAKTLNDIADQGDEGEDEGEDEGPEEGPDVEEEEEAPKAKTKKPFPGFGSKKEMKY